jgi:group I intron endonuclease
MIYIYALIDPVTLEIRYIGKTNNLIVRLNKHLKESKKNPKTHKQCWLNTLLLKNLKPLLKILEECINDEWQEREKYWISLYDNLTNLTEGGDNPPSHKGLKRKENHKKALLNANLGKQKSQETKDKISNARKERKIKGYWEGKHFSEEHCKNMSLSRIGKIVSEEQKEKLYIPIIQKDLNNNFIKEWKSASIAAKELNLNTGSINNVLKNRRKTYKNYLWEYKK